MALTDRQIERYSRQILVVGGAAQERLLRAHISVSGPAELVETALRYLAGAGVARITLELLDDPDGVARRRLLTRIRTLSSGLAINGVERAALDLQLMISARDGRVADSRQTAPHIPAVLLRLGPPVKLVILGGVGGLPADLAAVLSAPISGRTSGDPGDDSDLADFLTMIAVTEALKLLTGTDKAAGAFTIEFAGYQTRARSFDPGAPLRGERTP